MPTTVSLRKRNPGSLAETVMRGDRAESPPHTSDHVTDRRERHGLVGTRAYEFSERRGRPDGDARDKWRQAEREVQGC